MPLTPTEHERIWELFLRGQSHSAIASELSYHRNTVGASIRKTQQTLAGEQAAALSAERIKSLATYDLLQRRAWQALNRVSETSTAAIGWGNLILSARKQADKVLGLEPVKPDDPSAQLALFKQVVTSVILTEAPELGGIVAQRLLEAAAQEQKH